MFQQTRLKLTIWYLMILTAIVLLFSSLVYQLVNNELSRVARSQRNRAERFQVVVPSDPSLPPLIFFDEVEVAQLRERLLIVLVTGDIIIILLAGGMSYILAGKTLAPIQKMIEQQEQFVADSSHELRTPLTALRTSMEVAIRDMGITNSAKEIIEGNLKEVIRLQTLAESLLELTRTGKKLALSKQSSLQAIHNSVVGLEKIAMQNNITIKIPSKDIPVWANKIALERVITIVLDNAIKYSNKNSVIKISSAIKGKLVLITVTDRGTGIEQSQIPKVFKRFYRADSARSSTTPGYGLGLSIAQELLRAQSGEIKIESKLGVGTKVILHIPASA